MNLGARMPEAPKRVKFAKLACKEQVQWGGNDDPNYLLELGQVYEVSSWEEHSWHTKVRLVDFPGKKFNSVNFEVVE